MWHSASIAFLLCMASAIQGLNIEGAKEGPCFNITANPTRLVNTQWAFSIKTIYYPMMSTLDLYRSSSDLLQKDPKDISTGSIYYDSCLKWYQFKNGSIFSEGFNGLTKEYTTKARVVGDLDVYDFEPVEGERTYAGTSYTTLTDNDSYFFSVVCLHDGQRAWGVGSVSPTLPEDTKQVVLRHAESLGFQKEFFTELRYDRCNIDNDMSTTESTDKPS